MKDIILGIESSCDDTSAAVISNGLLLSNVIASQQVHEAYGGVVPELASRMHQQNIVPVVSEALRQAGVEGKDLSAIAYTRGPGLLGSLHVGTSKGKFIYGASVMSSATAMMTEIIIVLLLLVDLFFLPLFFAAIADPP